MLQDLINRRETQRKRLKIHQLRSIALEKDLQDIITELQATCPHDDVLHETTYHGGGYDYCASTDHTWTCKTCDLLLKHETKSHHGIFG